MQLFKGMVGVVHAEMYKHAFFHSMSLKVDSTRHNYHCIVQRRARSRIGLSHRDAKRRHNHDHWGCVDTMHGQVIEKVIKQNVKGRMMSRVSTHSPTENSWPPSLSASQPPRCERSKERRSVADREKQRKKEKYKTYNPSLHTERATQSNTLILNHSSRDASAKMWRPRLQICSGLAAGFCECSKIIIVKRRKKRKETKAKPKKQQRVM